ncbi:MAG TPA: pitrilysin family protein, partial [Candidatus Acidoferrales bacterium]|nr:pitrilysin family protein [Candidatus Acidoferrales bacterium]
MTTPMRHAGSLSFALALRAGSLYDPPRRAGLAHFLEHLIFKSTRDFSRHQIAATMQRCGNRFDPTTSKEMISIAGTVPMGKVDSALELVASVTQRPLFDRNDLETERQVVLEELRDWEVDPSKWIEVLTDQTLWGSHPLGRDTGGTRASVRDITRDHVRRFHRKFFHPANAVLSLAGPMRAEEMVKVAEDHFGAWRPAPGATFPKRPPNITTTPSAPQNRRSRVVRRADTQQVWFSLSTTTPSYPDGHRAMLNTQLAQVLVGDGDGSRLWDGLRERLGLAYEVYATLDFYAEIGVMSAKAAVGRTRAASAVKETKRILADTVARGFSKDEVARGKDALAAQIELVAEWNAANAARYAELALFDQALLTPAQELSMLRTIGAREFNGFVAQRLRWDQAAVCAIGEGPALAAIA